jgi:chaperonin GroEL
MDAQLFGWQGKGSLFVGENEEQPGAVDWTRAEGSQTFAMGYASRQFVTDPEADLAVLAKPIVLVVRGEVSEQAHIWGVMEQLQKHQRCLLLVAGLVTGAALTVLEVNKTRGVYQSAAVYCGMGADGEELLQAVTAFAGGQIVSQASELRTSKQLIMPGQAAVATISATSTILEPVAVVPPAPSAPAAAPSAGRGLFGRGRRRS